MTARSNPLLRLNAICPYYTMFPLSFPLEHLAEAQPGDWLLDPFCGRGTAGFAARLKGVSSVNIDISPVAVAIAAAKLVSTTPEEIVAEAEAILSSERLTDPVPSGPFWDLAFHPRTLEDICRIRQALLRTGPVRSAPSSDNPRWAPNPQERPARTALRALMLGVLHGPRNRGAPSYLSNQMPRTYATKPEAAVRFWRRNGLRPEPVDVLSVIRRRAHFTFAQLPPATQGYVLQADSRSAAVFDLLKRIAPPFRWVITSPPYYGMRFYLSDQWLRYWFLGGPPTVEYGRTGQMGSQPLEPYLDDLAHVWRLVASVCEPGARLVVRFGVIPSLAPGDDPASLALASLERAGGMWEVTTVCGAGRPPHQRRQAEQFSRPGMAPEEVDVVARRSTAVAY